MRTTRSVVTAAVLIMMIGLGLEARDVLGQVAQTRRTQTTENIEGITVSGKATAYARPDLMEIDLQVASASELTADAIVKYRDAKARIEEAFENLKLDQVEVAELGLLVDQKGPSPNQYGGIDPRATLSAKPEVQLSRKLVVRCSAIEGRDEEELLQLVARLLDVAQDAGGIVGPPPGVNPYQYSSRGIDLSLVRFVVEDFDAVQEQAYEAAIADARARAERIARLSETELGPIVAIQELSRPGDPIANVTRVVLPNEEPPREGRLESNRLQDVPVRVELLVRFQLRPAEDEGADTP
ncbi:SIMPL domain-containing protein [Tautonia marina]|uniref:SIMPL domain-containing protein n=1 Tax=Tautonia marina TaxID=2653855 RepID=UPI001375896A|nr:SIMPL domain-containing protein [Tautonia marina]